MSDAYVNTEDGWMQWLKKVLSSTKSYVYGIVFILFTDDGKTQYIKRITTDIQTFDI